MADSPAHEHKAEHNEKVAVLLENLSIFDWAMVVLFYAALHRVDAYFYTTHGRDFKNHEERNLAVANEPALRPAANSYRTLYKEARNARYRAEMAFTANELTLVRLAYQQFKTSPP